LKPSTLRGRWPRRRLLIAAIVEATGTATPTLAAPGGPATAAPRWPTRPLRIRVAYPPGGVSDDVARALADRLAVRLETPVLVENRPGASGTLALRELARATPDGQALVFAAVSSAALLGRGPGPGSALAVLPVAGVMRTPLLVAGTPALGPRGFADMLALARARPGTLRWASTGEGTTGHAVLERVRRLAGVDIVHIPYKGGGRQLIDALGGQFEVLSTNVAAQQLREIGAGRLTALAVGAPQRLAVLPGTPTLAELGFASANLDSLFGLFAPPGLAAPRLARLHAEVAAVLREDGLRAHLLRMNNTPYTGSPEDFAQAVLDLVHR
jgi:tripartite-type tricarboxylate transporter receptor subunit TctC